VDVHSGAHLWTETFDRDLQLADIFELQDEITDRVVATVADQYGVLARSMAMAAAAKSPETLTPYEAVLRFFLYAQRVTPEDHRLTRTALEHAVATQPDYADAWACLATMFLEEHRLLFNPQPNSLDRALHAAERAVDADPANQMANYATAVTHFFRGDLGAFRARAERALALNARESSIMAYLGTLYCFSGDWERGIPLTTRAMNLNPHHAGWYHFALFFNQYRQRHYAEALAIAQNINLPEYFGTHYVTAIAQAQLGNQPAAKAAVERTLQLWPDFEENFVAGHLQKWIFNQPELIAHIVEGLELAGFRLRRINGDADSSGERGD
jgi:tetratricopeptide (TPR) repeat protein